MFKHGFPKHWTTLKKLIWLKGAGIIGAASAIWKTVTGTLIHITDALASPVKALSIAIEPQQSGTGDPSPTNIRPITGWTGCNVYARGENLYDSSQALLAGYLKADGTTGGSSSSANKHTYKIPIKGGVQYTVKTAITRSSDMVCCWYGKNGTTVVGSFTIFSGYSFATVISPNDAHYLSITIYNVTNQKCALCVGETADVNAIYSGTTYPISWQTEAGTVYGGTLTINEDGSVDLVADKVELTFDGSSDESWKFVSASRKFAECSSLTLDIKYTDGDAVPPIISNIAVSVPRNASYSAITYAAVSANNLNTKIIRFLYAGVTDTLSLSNFKTWLSNNNLQVVYEIAEPVTYHLDSIEQLYTLAGENNIWADVNGTITLTYKSDGRDSDKADTGKADFMKLLS